MNPLFKILWVVCFALGQASIVTAEYTETMDPNGLIQNLQSDFGLVDDGAQSNQSVVMQRAIDDIAAAGGGRLVLPKGTYRFAGVYLKSNVHLLIEQGTVIKPYWPEGTKAAVFIIDAQRPSKKKGLSEADERVYIENVSIRGVGGPFVIDYSDRDRRKGEGVRGILGKMVKNFLIENVDLKDNFSVYCGITLTPLQTKYDSSDWSVSRATDGTVRNCRIFNASPGYGLTQLHGAQSVHFENIYAKGGVTLRLETGAVGDNTAVYDISAKNVINENGRCAVMMGPHSAMNGIVRVDGVTSISSAYAVTIGKGGVKAAELEQNPDAVDGIFAAGSYVKNIHAIFGKTAQIKKHAMLEIPEAYYGDLKMRWENKFFEGPSIGAVKDSTAGHYTVIVEDVTLEGFEYNTDKPILTEQDARPGKWGKAVSAWEATEGLKVGAPAKQ
ncbi:MULTISPECIES: glycosyl hydrolase family 28-related protein [unclassified Lentimonas]|uniref:glycosyl hydrolase family 28-related protein n=1 Tax=unclassified Lentimonas TaxID=2630993 RepID=UPI001323FBBD|nr:MULTISPECIES: glycosyl hydrolase family 28-related protein [unclassified Lentimonas]CAA6692721.1 Unannotated [Lentimonas sp. CC10]CAA6696713.1 Unannotated [Lentimonas sp. CC19]CAA7072307.1 Unannotated [Lentimonas sp. CC11]